MNREAKGQGSEPGAQRPLQERLRRRGQSGKESQDQRTTTACILRGPLGAGSVLLYHGRKKTEAQSSR